MISRVCICAHSKPCLNSRYFFYRPFLGGGSGVTRLSLVIVVPCHRAFSGVFLFGNCVLCYVCSQCPALRSPHLVAVFYPSLGEEEAGRFVLSSIAILSLGEEGAGRFVLSSITILSLGRYVLPLTWRRGSWSLCYVYHCDPHSWRRGRWSLCSL